VLMVAFQFPPFSGSSAVQRTLRFVRYLPEFGWTPLVLTAHPRAYEQASYDQLDQIPSNTIVKRAFSLDVARHLGIMRRYPARLARPDRWRLWGPPAIFAGLRMIRKYRPDALWSTFPIPTAHVIGKSLRERSRLPWIADFRDPMVQPNDPDDAALWRAYEKVERETIAESQLNVFTTDGTCQLYRSRYPERPRSAFAVVENGYDEDVFESIERDHVPRREPRLLLLHSGAIYPLERDPTQFFLALREFVSRESASSAPLHVRLRASGHDREIRKLINETGVGQSVELAPSVPYREAISEMLGADALLVLQAGQVKTQVPAKVYEYLRARRPILALTDPDGETGRLLRRAGVRHIAPIDSKDAIVSALQELVRSVRTRTAALPDEECVRLASRRRRAGELAALLNRISISSAR